MPRGAVGKLRKGVKKTPSKAKKEKSMMKMSPTGTMKMKAK